MGSCELDTSVSHGTAPYWKIVDLIVYSIGPFLATFLVNTGIIISIYRSRRLQSQFVSARVRFLTNPNRRVEEENVEISDVEREVALVEPPASNPSVSNEIREPFVEETTGRAPGEQLIKADAISQRRVPRSQTRKNTFVLVLQSYYTSIQNKVIFCIHK